MNRVNSLSRNTAIMALGTMMSRVTGFGRVFALGYALDYTNFTGTYALANQVPNIIYELVLGGILTATLVPVFVRNFTLYDEDEAWRATMAIATTVFAVLVGISAVLFVAAPWIIDLYTLGNHTDSRDAQREVATFLLRLFIPQLAFYGFISLATGILQSKRIFGPPMFAPIFNNLVVICVLLALPHLATDLSLEGMLGDTTALVVLGLGTTAGVFAMALYLFPYILKLGKNHLKVAWNPKHPAVIDVIRMSGWTFGFVLANQVALWVTFMLANGKPKDVAIFTSAYALFILPHGIFSVSVMNALAPELAERWSQKNLDGFRQQLILGLRTIMAAIIPTTALYAVIALPITTLLLDHGRIQHDSVHQTAQVLFWMLLGLPGFSIFIYFTRCFQSMQNARTVFYLYLLQNGANIVTAVPLYHLMGVTGLGLSQSIAYGVAALAALIAIRSRVSKINGRPLASSFFRTIGAAIAITGIASIALLVSGNTPWVQVPSAIITGGIGYLLAARLFKISELEIILKRRKGTQNSQATIPTDNSIEGKQ